MYFYIDQDKLDCYLSDFSRPKKIKGGNLDVEITLPFIKISAAEEFSKNINGLSARQKAVLFEKLLENNENELFFDLSNLDVDATTILPNSFIRLHCDLKVSEMVDMINGLTDLLKGKLSNFTQQQKIKSDASNAELIMVLSEKKLSTPIVLECDNKSISKIDTNYILEEDKLTIMKTTLNSMCLQIMFNINYKSLQ